MLKGLGWCWSYSKTKSCLLEGRVVCLLKGRGDIASMEYGTGPGMTGHDRGCIGCVASCPFSGSAQGDNRYKNKVNIFHYSSGIQPLGVQRFPDWSGFCVFCKISVSLGVNTPMKSNHFSAPTASCGEELHVFMMNLLCLL